MSTPARPQAGSEVGEILGFCRTWFELASSMCWRSYDPFDFLLISFGDALRRRSRLAARSLIAIGKQTGSRGRLLARIASHEEPTAVADFLSAAALLSLLGATW